MKNHLLKLKKSLNMRVKVEQLLKFTLKICFGGQKMTQKVVFCPIVCLINMNIHLLKLKNSKFTQNYSEMFLCGGFK